MKISQYISNEVAMRQFGKKLLEVIFSIPREQATIIFLRGDLGAGKTTLTRGMIQGAGFDGNVKSPTYTLVEEYQVANKRIFHFDLYRLADAEELEFMGIRDYFASDCVCLIEWAEKGEGFLPPADLIIQINYFDDARELELIAQNAAGEAILQQLS